MITFCFGRDKISATVKTTVDYLQEREDFWKAFD